MLSSSELLYPVSGLFVGFLVGLTGVGGGSLMTPLLILLFGIHPTTAVGTDLLYAAATKAAGTLMHNASNTVEWKIVRRLAPGLRAGDRPHTAMAQSRGRPWKLDLACGQPRAGRSSAADGGCHTVPVMGGASYHDMVR
jgi:hypothetical protein